MRQHHKKLGLLHAFVVVFAAGLAMITSATHLNAASAKTDPDKIGKVILAVSGMTCGGCASNINSALSEFQGITDTKIDIAGGKVNVLYHIDTRNGSPTPKSWPSSNTMTKSLSALFSQAAAAKDVVINVVLSGK